MNLFETANPARFMNLRRLAAALEGAKIRGAETFDTAAKAVFSALLTDAKDDNGNTFEHFNAAVALAHGRRPGRGYAFTVAFTVKAPSGLWAILPKDGAAVRIPEEIEKAFGGE